MDKKFEEMTIHQKMEILIKDMVEKEVRYRDALKEFQKSISKRPFGSTGGTRH